MGVGLEQGLVFVLAVDIDQQLAQVFSSHPGDMGRAVDIAAERPSAVMTLRRMHGPSLLRSRSCKPGFRFGDVCQVEGRQDIGLVCAGAYHATVGAVSQGQA